MTVGLSGYQKFNVKIEFYISYYFITCCVFILMLCVYIEVSE